jgi:hypothetical protein
VLDWLGLTVRFSGGGRIALGLAQCSLSAGLGVFDWGISPGSPWTNTSAATVVGVVGVIQVACPSRESAWSKSRVPTDLDRASVYRYGMARSTVPNPLNRTTTRGARVRPLTWPVRI